eukprot:g1656.t1
MNSRALKAQAAALQEYDELQRFVERLRGVQRSSDAAGGGSAGALGSGGDFVRMEWARDGGAHGGGARFQFQPAAGDAAAAAAFCQASVNVSHVHYDDVPTARIDSATALSVIVHPASPRAPSIHFHVSFMEPRGASGGYWRIIADLNPAIADPGQVAAFEAALRAVVPPALLADARRFGDDYFYIPALERHRGAVHLFVAKLADSDHDGGTGGGGGAGDAGRALALALRLGERVIDTYAGIAGGATLQHPRAALPAAGAECRSQLEYHTLYFFQVLTLDRGTTHGLLAHADNDVGTLGSLPPRVDGALLARWAARLPAGSPQRLLLRRLIAALPRGDEGVSDVTAETRQALAGVVRAYYREDMSRARLQAKMDMAWWGARPRDGWVLPLPEERESEAGAGAQPKPSKVRQASTMAILEELARRSKQQQEEEVVAAKK